jgi:dipeptidyl aminopeptidase/acylaminoacyl peptidase
MELHFNRSAIGNWSQKTATPRSTQADLEIAQDLKSPPVLVAKANGKSRSTPIWNPNAGLDWAKIGPVELFEAVTDRNERVAGGLYLPPGYNPTKRYPLVIQNHGFNSYEFVPSGVYPTSFAARELASVGIVVLQLKDCPERGSTDEGDCQLRAYRTAIATLARRGLIDPDRVGIIGFSRTCYYVLKALYAAGLSFRAASITDGIDAGYWQYMMSADDGQNIVAGDAASLIGANPWGEGLRVWAALSPAFNTDKMTTPLQIVATNDYSLLSMWQAYAALRYQRKPVELVKLDTDEHVLTNPATRLMSQGGTVDWMRFWLQDYEDPDPAKTGQYTQWRAMRRLDSR